jgi:NAD+ synthase (glutamine-hydrolysing)
MPLLHLALAQFKPKKGDYRANISLAASVIAEASELSPRPHVVQLPETAFSGYFLEGGVREVAVTAGQLAQDLNNEWREVAGDSTIDVVAGFYEIWDNSLYNSAIYLTLGESVPQVLHVHRKNFLPTYGLFDEERFVERGHDISAFDTQWGRAAMLVCEDAWHSLSGTIAALDGAQVLFVCAAAPARGLYPRIGEAPGPASVQRWDRLVRDIAEEHGMFTTLANLVGSEGGKMFSGASMVA